MATLVASRGFVLHPPKIAADARGGFKPTNGKSLDPGQRIAALPAVSLAVHSRRLDVSTESLIVLAVVLAYFAVFMGVLAYATLAESR
ncbi:hypothetical protein, partial [Mesorhizobium sp. M1C.F.Ca.ET.187.01.1.1]|uniref:hypothetical protein n=1 Tax=Mesorhizobium sp. M1C.F.Ca.ET.187.01.1.1 TaxID=2563923 RepID=UPI0010922243